MVMVATTGLPRRHPWLLALQSAPEAELQALIGGYADIPPYGRAEPADAAVSLLFGLPADDPAVDAFDCGCLALLSVLRDAIPKANEERQPRYIATLDRLLAVIRRVRPSATVRSLHERYAYWFRLVETAIVDQGLDLRREFWRVLALTQDDLAETAAPRRLMALWLEVCGEAGPLGRYDETYLDVGLIGLRRLPLGTDDDSNEELVCRGIARWAARQFPDKKTFVSRWNEVEAAYPRSPSYWPPLVEDVIASAEEALDGETEQRMRTFPASAWWREAMELPPVPAGQRAKPSGRKRVVEPPARDMHEEILKAAASPIALLMPRVDRLRRAHRRYADTTGDTYYLVRTACNVGMRVLRESPSGETVARGEIATVLAREALAYAPNHVFAWVLWRDSLVARGAPEDAEKIGWESVRRYPEDPQQRTQLATLIGSELNRPEEAEQLLRDTVALFPLNEAVRPQLATLLTTAMERHDEAVAVLREAIRLVPDHPHNYNQLAILLASRYGDIQSATELLNELLRRHPDNRMASDLLARIVSGQKISRPQRPATRKPMVRGAPIDLGFDVLTAQARRALFRLETSGAADREAAGAEVARYLASDPAEAYLRYAAQRAGIDSEAFHDTAFAFAFDRAARSGSVATFEALVAGSAGMDRYIARAGLSLISNVAPIDRPPGANDAAPASLSRRFALLSGDISRSFEQPNIDRRHFLRLVSDFAAAGLSAALAA